MDTVTLEAINQADAEQFVELLGGIYEHSPWVAKRCYAERPFHSVEELQETMKQTVEDASTAEQLALLRAHPELGANTELTETSEAEQASAGLDQLTPDRYETFQQLNRQYHDRFEFPFIMAVKDESADAIQEAMEDRLEHSRETEFRTALEEVHTIAAIRLEELLAA